MPYSAKLLFKNIKVNFIFQFSFNAVCGVLQVASLLSERLDLLVERPKCFTVVLYFAKRASHLTLELINCCQAGFQVEFCLALVFVRNEHRAEMKFYLIDV